MAEDLIEEGKRTAKESRRATGRILGRTDETIAVADATIERSHQQGEQIRRIQDDLDQIHENSQQIAHDLRVINSIGGQLLPGSITAQNSVSVVDKILTKDEQKRAKQRAKEQKKAAKQRAKAEKKAEKAAKRAPLVPILVAEAPKAPKAEKARRSVTIAGHSLWMTETVSGSFIRVAPHLPSELSVLGDEALEDILAVEEDLYQISGQVRILKDRAIQIGDQLEDSGKQLDKLNETTHQNNLKTRQLEHQTNRLL